MLHKNKLQKSKKTLEGLLHDGEVKLGAAVLAEKAQKAKEVELFLAAAQEEARMRRFAANKER